MISISIHAKESVYLIDFFLLLFIAKSTEKKKVISSIGNRFYVTYRKEKNVRIGEINIHIMYCSQDKAIFM